MLDAVRVPEVLLPAKHIDYRRWAVVACDQFTSEPHYWEEVEQIAGDAPSALRLIFPEAMLAGTNVSNETAPHDNEVTPQGNEAVPHDNEIRPQNNETIRHNEAPPQNDEARRIRSIHAAMRSYLAGGVFGAPQKGFVLVERATRSGVRLGILMQIDLNAYNHQPGSKSLVRPTEGTVLSRVPPRVRVRKGAPLELPHAMLLADDPERSLAEPLYQKRQSLPLLYDFELMLNGGHLRGWLVNRPDDIASIFQALAALPSLRGDDPILFAVGDGNHSLAAAKQCYLDAPTEENRYALVEVVNLHQDSIRFEPIHRLLQGVDADSLQKAAAERGVSIEKGDVLSISPFLDEWLPAGAAVDYIHGDETLERLAARQGYVGIKLKGIPKDALFPSLAGGKVLPRKAFSMGDAEEKRYYLECRRIGMGEAP